ncbi:chaplin family protein [Streptomyces sp. NPDC002952]|uniref:chaplin family protein n=1 Tax=Streptomyces sp. NPDC002952 TaxID=3364673 RepID=UPI0036B16778
MRKTAVSAALTAVVGTGVVATPAFAGGIGSGLSPAFGNECSNRNTDALAHGATTDGVGAAGGNALAVPITGPRNQCGGADLLPVVDANVFVILDGLA